MTLSKIAKLANVSVSTASKAFSMSREVNEETRKHIFKVARAHGCFKKFYNAKYPKWVVAVILPEFDSIYYTTMLTAIQKELALHNCDICVSSTGFSTERQKELLEYYSTYSAVDGIILIENVKGNFPTYETPMVSVGSSLLQKNTLFWDNDGISDRIVKEFIKRGIYEIGFVGEFKSISRLDNLKAAIISNGLSYDESLVSITDKRFSEGGFLAMEALFERNKVPRGLVCSYDYIAVGAMHSIQNHGLSIPEDVALIGFDDIPIAKHLNPPLSSVNFNTELASRSAVNYIMNILTGDTLPVEKKIPVEIILRESTDVKKQRS